MVVFNVPYQTTSRFGDHSSEVPKLAGSTKTFFFKTSVAALDYRYSVCVIYCVVIPFILDVRFVDVPAGVTQEKGHTGFFIHLPPAELALIFLARRIQPFLSLVDLEVYRILCTNESIVLHFVFINSIFYFFVRKNPSSCDDTEI